MKYTKTHLFIVGLFFLLPFILFGQDQLDKNRIYPAPVGGKAGYIDYTGQFVIPPIYHQTRSFCPDNRAAIVSTKLHDGIIGLKGELLVPMIYSSLSRIKTMKDAYGYLYLASKGDKYGVINLANEVIIPFEYDHINPEVDYFMVKKDGKVGVLNLSNEVVLPLEYEAINQNLQRYAGFRVQEYNDKWALFDEMGKQVCDPIFDDLNIEITAFYINGRSEGKNITIDYYGMVHPNFDFNVSGFNQRAYSIVKTKEQLYGLIDVNYNWIIEPKYEGLFYDTDIENNQIILFKENNKWGIMDVNGAVLLLPECKDIIQISSTIFGLSLDDKGYRLFDLPSNRWITTEEYYYIYGVEEGVIEINVSEDQYADDIWGLLNFEGEMVLEPDSYFYIYIYIEPNVFELYGQEDDNSTGIYNTAQKKLLIPPIFDLVYYEPNHLVEVNYLIDDDSRYKVAYLDRQGNVIWTEPDFEVQKLMDAFYEKHPRYAK
jgi:hypothetical protein